MNTFQFLFDKQKDFFFSDISKTYEWRLDQLSRLENLLTDNQNTFCEALHKDFGKPPFEQLLK